ncbi:galactose mutarotase-like protein [Pseudovirgaria hyperparasitica]|uniref:rhamnogalacturonan endolyase n=1 Tax=Pseudovirgaria hyperparasitica TaxID=470096 RepID=A0A6A6W6D7_9PEZI|nr:galactose mutarotase-like protein [Pseudovirgaria hyperparasitica]KAF2757127.1 galactose mutarotase-like protein [Pseudovirgaria hyperparasitica]
MRIQDFICSAAGLLPALIVPVCASLTTKESSTAMSISNSRLAFSVSKSTGSVASLSLDGQNLLGTGRGPYLDCHCIASGQWTPGSGASYTLYNGTDSTGIAYGGVRMSHEYQKTGTTLEQYWFLREGETGLHMFSRAAYHNSSVPDSGNDLGEFRTLFRPSASIWTHLSSSDGMYGPLPNTTGAPVVQDATWYVGGNKSDPYVREVSDYFTKYMFSETWRDTSVHGMYADGRNTANGSTFGAWLVMNTKDTYYGGPTHSDLTVDGIVYNYLTSNHHGDGVPAMLDGFDRTFGPQYYYFNKGTPSSTLQDLRKDASQFADPNWAIAFYDSISKYVPGYTPSSDRGTWQGTITLPPTASRPIAVLAANNRDFQDNNFDTPAYQYWADIDPSSGTVRIPNVKAGTYRLTVYADGIFGAYTQDNIVVAPSKTQSTTATWTPTSHGTELWRIDTPDRSAGEFRHGNAPDLSRTRHPAQYRLYWAVHDFPSDFPNGVVFDVDKDDVALGLNYAHWSVFGGKANSLRPEPYYANVNNWTLTFGLEDADLAGRESAVLTVQLAGAKTSTGNNDDADGVEKAWVDLPFTVVVNGVELPVWVIPSNHSSSCAARSAATCYTLAHEFAFATDLLRASALNTIVLSLPANATAPETAVLPESVYVQYDALRLEVG